MKYIAEANPIKEALETVRSIPRSEVAKLLGVANSTLQCWESGARKPKKDPEWYAERIRALGCLTREGREGILNGQNSIEDALSWYKAAEAKKASKWGSYEETYRRNRERIPDDIADALTAEQLGRLADIVKEAYDAGKGE